LVLDIVFEEMVVEFELKKVSSSTGISRSTSWVNFKSSSNLSLGHATE